MVRWSKAYSQLPQGRVQNNNTALRLLHVSKTDSDTYLCSASNILGFAARRTLLVVVPLPTFIKKPPTKLIVSVGVNVTLNCSAAGDPKPTIRWTRQGGQLPLGRSPILGNTLIIRVVKVEDTGNYTCIATSAGLSKAFAMSYVSVIKPGGKFDCMIIQPKHNILCNGIWNSCRSIQEVIRRITSNQFEIWREYLRITI